MDFMKLAKQPVLHKKAIHEIRFKDLIGNGHSNGTLKKIGIAGGITAAGALAIASYPLLIRPWHLKWGANGEEIKRTMPGDEKIPDPEYVTTRAITINAKPEDIWPWLIQMGYQRGGLYSYDWLDQLFGYLDQPSSEKIIPEHQQLKEGDVIPIGKSEGFPVQYLEQYHSLVLGKQENGYGWTWAIGLYPVDEHSTRLVTRNRFRLKNDVKTKVIEFFLDPASFIMIRKWMMGIKERAEKPELQKPVKEKTAEATK